MREVTFGITTFERPHLLANLVRSIYQRYPLAKVVVADNGRQKATLPGTVEVLRLPFDCGLSAARNALIDTLQTEYLLILEDDFLFTDETRIEPLVEVLKSDPEVGVVGGALRSLHGRVAAYALDIEVFRDTMSVREATHRVKFTPGGVPYRLCDMVWNFALFRRQMLAEHRWDDQLKVGEHCPFFHQVKLAARWRVAACASTRIYHVPEHRSRSYLKYRRRAQDLFQGYLSRHGITKYHRVLPYHFEDDEAEKPCMIVFGVGHSGTTVVTRMLNGLGWNAADADQEFFESCSIRELNKLVLKSGKLPADRARKVLDSLPKPWVIKDPRFVSTLHHWLPLFASMDRKPVLLKLRRDRQSMLGSYSRRQAPGDFVQRVDQLLQLAEGQYDRWPWGRLTVEYERLAQAIAPFQLSRFLASNYHLEPSTPREPADGSKFDSAFGALDSAFSGFQAHGDSVMLGTERDSAFADEGELPLCGEMDGSVEFGAEDGSL